jgi:hypothetical protein
MHVMIVCLPAWIQPEWIQILIVYLHPYNSWLFSLTAHVTPQASLHRVNQARGKRSLAAFLASLAPPPFFTNRARLQHLHRQPTN